MGKLLNIFKTLPKLQTTRSIQRYFISGMSDEQLLISVNTSDKPLRPVGKLFSHLSQIPELSNTDKYNDLTLKSKQHGYPPILHRAFSNFHFSQDGRLLLTQRAASKQTFPLQWTNSCCSHPLWSNLNERGSEQGDADAETLLAVQNAVSRRMKEELGLQLVPNKFNFITRLVYLAHSGSKYSEYEMVYIFTSIHNKSARINNDFEPDPNELSAHEWLYKHEIEQKMERNTFTPWSLYMLKNIFFPNWNNLSSGVTIGQEQQKKIYYAGDLTLFGRK